MSFRITKILLFLSCFVPAFAFGKVRVLTTTTDLKAIVEEVGGSSVSVDAFCTGTQDPHFLEAKPSYIVNTSRADLVVSIGLGLEIGWLPKVLAGGRNSKVMEGTSGYLEVGPKVEVLEVPKGPINRAEGDVHPEGNPHVTLDPVRVGQIALLIAERLSSFDPKAASDFSIRAKAMQSRLLEKSKHWQQRINQAGFMKVVTHHKTLSYFFDRFGMESVAMLEPLPGVSPTANHVLKVIKQASEKGVKKILVENYFSDAVAQKVSTQISGISVESVPVAVLGESEIRTHDDLFEALVKKIESNGKAI
jgi:zinc/manganese transport system substrate-binding protein